MSNSLTKTQTIPTQTYLVLAFGILTVSLASIFIKLAQAEEMPSLLIAAGRMTIAALILTPITLRSHRAEISRLTRSDIILAIFSGFWLAVHFAAWISSLEYTSVLISTVIVAASPIWAAILEVTFLKARFGRLLVIGLALALIGNLIISIPDGSDGTLGSNPLLGSVLALVGAIAIAVQRTIGRKLRAHLSILTFIWLVYSFAALFLIPTVVLARIPVTGYTAEGYWWLLVLAVVPQLFGHSSFNYALRYMPATYVSLVIQIEPVGASIAAFFLFGEVPGVLALAGSVVLLIGVLLATLNQSGTETSSSNDVSVVEQA